MTIQQYKNEQAEKCYMEHGCVCVHCGKPATQLAHIIPQDVPMLRKYGYKIIHHWRNREPVCDLKCNAKSSIRNHPLAIAAKVREIKNENVMWEADPPKEK